MTRVEYRIVEMDPRASDVEGQLNELAEEGWRVAETLDVGKILLVRDRSVSNKVGGSEEGVALIYRNRRG